MNCVMHHSSKYGGMWLCSKLLNKCLKGGRSWQIYCFFVAKLLSKKAWKKNSKCVKLMEIERKRRKRQIRDRFKFCVNVKN